MAGRIMTRMTTDIDALSQLLQNGLVNALVNLVTFVGVGIALVFMNPQLALITRVDPAAADHRDDLVPVRSRRKAYEIARERIAAVNANLQEGLSGVRVSQAFVREERNQEVFDRDRGRLPRRARARAAARRDLLPVRRLPLRHRRVRRARRRQRARRERLAVGRRARSRSCSTSTCSSRRSSSSRRCSTRTSRRGSRSSASPSCSTRRRRCRRRRSPSCPAALRGRGRARRRAVQVLDRDRRSAARRRPAHRAGRDGRARRRDRRGQVAP